MIQRWLVWGNLTLTALLGYSLALGGVGMLENRLDNIVASSSPISASQDGKTEDRELLSPSVVEEILNVNAFQARRNPQPLPKIFQGKAGGVPVAARLPVSLAGTALLGDISFAFVTGQNGGNQRAYQLNECLPANEKQTECASNQGKLLKIRPFYMEVSYNGQLQRYDIQRGEATSAGLVTGTVKRKKAGESVPVPKGGALLPSSRKGKRLDVRVPNVEVQQAFENFASLLKQALIVPYEENGEPQGFRITKITPNGVFARLHLKDNDVIQKVNGHELATADQAIQLLNAFRNEKEIDLEIKRGGNPLQMRYLIQ